MDQAKQILNLPESAVPMGYIVVLPEFEEFLAYSRSSIEGQCRGWTHHPAFAARFLTFMTAAAEATAYGRDAIVAFLFEVGDYYRVIPVEPLE